MTSSFSTIEAATAAFARGEIVIVVDAEDRENEGDFVCAAEKATPEIVNFMINARPRPGLHDRAAGSLRAAQADADGR